MEKIWLKSYPKGVNPDINFNEIKPLTEIIADSIKENADKVAFENFGSSLTFNELDQLSDSFASFLVHHAGLKKGDRVAIQLPNLLQYPVVMFGALKAGLTVVNTNPLYTDREMKHQFQDAEVKALIIFSPFAHKYNKIASQCGIKTVITTEVGDLLGWPKSWLYNFVLNLKNKKEFKKQGQTPPSNVINGAVSFHDAINIGSKAPKVKVDVNVDDTAFLQYTGGTTGVAKGAVLSHKNVAANMLQILEWKKPLLTRGQEVIITPLPLYHIFSLTVNCFAFIHFGCKNILITNPRDIPAFIKLMRKERYTVMTGVNTLYNALMNHPDFTKINFAQLKIAVAGGMALQNTVCTKWEKLTGKPIIEGYGLTETSPVAACNPIDGTNKLDHIGLPLPSTDFKLVDDDESEVSAGANGEICISGPQVMSGYWNQPEENKKVFTKDGFFKTGDIGVMDNQGFFKIVDRKKDMIIVSGFNVYPNEVEDVIASHPKVLEVAAIGVPSEKSTETVKVFIVKRDQSLTEDEVKAYAKENLTGYKRPEFVEFRDELPKTNIGKILRRALKDEEAKKQ